MVRQRLIVAGILLACFFALYFKAPQSLWVGVIALILGVAACEWAKLMQAGRTAMIIFTLILIVMFLLPLATDFTSWHWTQPENGLEYAVISQYLLSFVLWFFIIPLWLFKRWPIAGKPWGWVMGVIILVPASQSMVFYRHELGEPLLVLIATVAGADTGAFFAGRAWGKHPLAAAISPKKTWEGVAGGVVGGLFCGLLFWYLNNRLETFSAGLIFALLMVVVFSVLGDLLESLIKRQAGVKDSGKSLGSHGGVLDRIDGLLATLPLAMLLSMFSYVLGG